MATQITEIGRLHYDITGSSDDLVKAVKKARTETLSNIDALTKQFVRQVELQNQAQARGAATAAGYWKWRQKKTADELAAEVKQYKAHVAALDNIQPTSFLGKLKKGITDVSAGEGGDILLGMFGMAGVAAAAVAIGSKFVEIAGNVISAGFSLAVESALKAATIQRYEIALTNIVGSSKEAKRALEEMIAASYVQPGLDFETAAVGVQRLRAVGFTADEAKRSIEGLTKVKMYSGATKQDMEAVILNFQQIRSYGKLTGDEMRETLMRMPYMSSVFYRAFGTINTRAIGEMGLSAKEVFALLLKEMDKIPPIAGGVSNAFEKVENAWNILQMRFGEGMLDALQKSAEDLVNAIKSNEKEIKAWGASFGDIITGLATMARGVNYLAQGMGGLGKAAELLGSVFGTLFGGPVFAGLMMLGGGLYGLGKWVTPKKEVTQSEARNTMLGESLRPPNQEERMAIMRIEQEQAAADRARVEAETKRVQDQSNKDLETYYGKQRAIITVGGNASTQAQIAALKSQQQLDEYYTERKRQILLDSSQAQIEFLKGQVAKYNAPQFRDKESDALRRGAQENLRNAEEKLAGDLYKIDGEGFEKRLASQRTYNELVIREAEDANSRQRASEMQFADSQLRIAEAYLDRPLRFTLEQEEQYTKDRQKVRETFIKSQISAETAYYNQKIQLYADDAGKVLEITAQKNLAIGKLETDLQVSQIENEKKIAEIHQQQLEKRRAASIQFYQLELRSAEVTAQNEARLMQRQAELGIITQEEALSHSLALEQQEYDAKVAMLRRTFDVEIQNEKLTAEERFNLQQKLHIDLEQAEGDHAQKVFEIERKQDEQRRERLRRWAESVNATLGSITAAYKGVFASLEMRGLMQLPSLAKYLPGGEQGTGSAGYISTRLQDSRNAFAEQITQYDKLIQSLLDRQKGYTEAERSLKESIGRIKTLGLSPDAQAQMQADLEQQMNAKASTRLALEALQKQFEEERQAIKELDAAVQQRNNDLIAAYQELEAGQFSSEALEKYRLRAYDIETQANLAQLQASVKAANAQWKQLTLTHQDESTAVLEAEAAARKAEQDRAAYVSERITGREQLEKLLVGTMQADLSRLRAGNIADWNPLQQAAMLRYLEEAKNVYPQIADEVRKFGETNEEVQDKIRLEWARTANEIKDRWKYAAIEYNKAVQEMADKTILHNETIRAKLATAIAAAPGLTDIFSEAEAGAVTDFYKMLDDSVAKLIDHLGLANTALGNFFQTILAGMAKLAAAKFFELLFGIKPDGTSANGSSTGGWWGRIVGMIIGSLGGAAGGGATAGGHEAPGGFGGMHGLESTGGGKTLAGSVPKGGIISGGGMTVQQNNYFRANENGNFNRESAEQATRRLVQMQLKVTKR